MISYKPFYDTLLKKNVTEYQLIFKEGISANTLHRMKKGLPITTKTLDTLCFILNCEVEDIIQHDKTQWFFCRTKLYGSFLLCLNRVGEEIKKEFNTKIKTRTPIHRGSPDFLCLFSLFGRNLVANSMFNRLKSAWILSLFIQTLHCRE